MFETATERAALASAWGDTLLAGTLSVPGQYEEPQAEDLLTEGTAPTFLAERAVLEAGGITYGSPIDNVITHDGRTRGPFKVVRWQSVDDGAFILLGLQVTA